MISIFPLWTFHLYVASFQQHMHMEYISLSWYNIPELMVPIRIFLSWSHHFKSFMVLFSFGRCIVCTSSIYRFWLPLWYLKTLLVTCHQLTKCILDVFLSQMVQNLAASVESFQIDQFCLYCRDLRQKKHTQVIF